MKLLITGANGFVSGALISRLFLGSQYQIQIALRRKVLDIPQGVTPFHVGDLGPETDWQVAVSGVNVVVHTAARVHVMDKYLADSLSEFRHVNVNGTLKLARQAAAAGVSRFIFISSAKVNGEGTPIDQPLTKADPPNPQDAYALSKWEAEQVLSKITEETGMEVVILRPPLVYGPGVKANFLRMIEFVARGIPLPFDRINNDRSFIYLGNLVEAIYICINHPKAAGQTYLVSDGEDVSTPELIRRVGVALGKSTRLFPFPPSLLRLAGKITGQLDAVERLVGSLTIDSSKIRRELGWKPPYTMEEGLKETAEWFRRLKINGPNQLRQHETNL